MDGYEKRGYLLENFRLFHLKSDGGEQVEFHYHEFGKILLLHAGQGGYYVDDRRYLLRAGDIVLIPSRSIHKPELDPASPYERTILYISPDYLEKISAEDGNLSSIFAGQKVLRPGEKTGKRLFSQAAALERDLEQPGFGREILSQADLVRFLVHLARALEQGDTPHPDPLMPESRRILEIMEYLDRNLTEEIHIDSLAERFFLSKYYMMRSFRRETGTSIYMYLTRKRLMLARQMMAEGMGATQACYASGFRNYSSFTRAWGKFFGTSPTGRSEKKLRREEDYE